MGTGKLVSAIAEVMAEKYGRFLILEIWPGESPGGATRRSRDPASGVQAPGSRRQRYEALTDNFEEALRKIRVYKLKATVDVVERSGADRPDCRPSRRPT